jgi:thiol-disulfide isomerase/thioredoxin
MNKIKKNKIKKNNIDNNFNSVYKNIYGEEKGIIELTLKDFIYDKNKKKIYINNPYFNDKKGFVIFYAPWCEHCVHLSDMLIDIALNNINLFPFGAVNIENVEEGNDRVAIYSKIKQLPTIKYIDTDKSLKDYNFKYNADNIIYYINTNV